LTEILAILCDRYDQDTVFAAAREGGTMAGAPMSRVVVILWLGSAASRLDAQPELDSWARARLVKLEDATAAATPTPAYDDALVRKIEELLEQARVATDTLDEATALSRLTEAAALIERHPELPQAAWLGAERLMAEAALRDRQPDGADRARALRKGARVLGERRVAPLAEASASAPDAAPRALLRVRIGGVMPQDRFFWDGRPAGNTLEIESGLHHARVVREGRTVWAGWTAVDGGGTLTLPVPNPLVCSLDDLGTTRISAAQVLAPRAAQCRTWAVARRTGARSIEIATCRGNRCGSLLPWRRGDGEDFSGPPQPAPNRSLPAWAFVAAGLGAAALTGTILWQAGVFDEPEPARDRVVFSGPARR